MTRRPLPIAVALASAVAAVALAQPAPAPAPDTALAAATATPLRHWRALDALAAPTAKSLAGLGDDVETRARAWGDPPAGVYAVLLEGRARRAARPGDRRVIAADVHDQLQASLAKGEGVSEDWSVQRSAHGIESRGALVANGYRGRAQAVSGFDDAGRLVAAVALCFFNDREARTADECERFLASIEVRAATAPLEADS